MSNQGYIYIDSEDRISGTISDFSILIIDHYGDFDKDISVESCAIPWSYYTINDNNNTFLCGPTGNDTITLTNGNYTGTELSNELKTQLDAVLTPTYTVAFDSNTGKLTFSTVDSSDFTITTDTKNNRYLGFNKSTNNTSTSGVLTSSNVIDISGTKFIEIRTNIPIVSENSRNLNRDVLLRIYPNSETFSTIFYEAGNNRSVHTTSDKLQRIEFQLYDDNDDMLDLNGLNWSISLKVVTKESLRSQPNY